MTSLVTIDFRYNQLSGSIPSTIGSLTKVQGIYLGFNQLTGTLPTTIGNLTAATYLQFSSNKLSGSLPPQLCNLTNLVYLYLDLNQLTGPLPSEFGNLTKLQSFYLSGNKLTGTLPTNFTNLTALVYLYLDGNQFQGTFNIGSLTHLSMLNISGNSFSGAFPSTIGSSTVLSYLRADNNQFTTLPAGILSLPVITTLLFNNNILTSIPNFGNHVNKANLTLNLSYNQLDFSQLEPQVGVGIHSLTYAPQNAIQDVTTVNAPLGSSLQINARPFTATTSIVWQKQSSPTAWTNVSTSNQDATGATYLINSTSLSTGGVYQYLLTDSHVPSLTISSVPITVNITDALNLPGSYQGTSLFDGSITAASWHTQAAYATGNSDYTGMYIYTYDDKYQLQQAQFAVPNFTLNTFALAGNNYRELGYAYDPNGNIQTLKRYDGNGNKIHDLSYSYTSNNNQLHTVTNGGAAFRNYTYSGNGQMTGQDNATGQDQYVNYDVTGKVTDVIPMWQKLSWSPTILMTTGASGFQKIPMQMVRCNLLPGISVMPVEMC